MQNIAIPTGGLFPASLRSIEDGDSLDTVNHGLQTTDVAAGLGWLKDRADELIDIPPVLTSGDQTIGGVKTFGDTPEFNAGFNVSGGIAMRVENIGVRSMAIPPDTSTITGTGNVTLSVTAGAMVYFAAAPTANRIITLEQAPAPAHGDMLTVVRPVSGAFTYEIRREGSGSAIVTLSASLWASATMQYVDPTGWKLLFASGSFTVGPDA